MIDFGAMVAHILRRRVFPCRRSAHERIDRQAWYTVGFHHVTRMEDWPVMPTHWFGFTLMPHDFFATNPAMTIRDAR
jgi:Cu2+-containing amine oxidase